MIKPQIRSLALNDISTIVSAFKNSNWTEKPVSLFEKYFAEHENQQRMVWIAFLENEFAGYITLKWLSDYPHFEEKQIPEIMDLNVLPSFRNKGIGSLLLKTAEAMAKTKSESIGLDVGLYGGPDGGYGQAQRLYVKQGYIPDGKGVTYAYKDAIPGNSMRLMTIWCYGLLKI